MSDSFERVYHKLMMGRELRKDWPAEAKFHLIHCDHDEGVCLLANGTATIDSDGEVTWHDRSDRVSVDRQAIVDILDYLSGLLDSRES